MVSDGAGRASETAAHVVADQSAVAAFLGRPASHGPDVDKVMRFDTHGAIVFLAGPRAYKIKRAVNFPYMDFSTLALRRAACEKELRLNRRTAPDLYLETRPVLRRPDGGFSFEGPGEPVEWVLVMRRFEQEDLFDRLARAERLTPELMTALTDAVVAFHAEAERLDATQTAGGGEAGLRDAAEETLEEFAERPDLFLETEVAAIKARLRDQLARHGKLLDARLAKGFVRRCHGDLHLRNICLLEGRPTLFDCIEFNDDFAGIDLLYDLAYLLMDLEHRGLRPLANLVFNRYFQSGEDLEGLATLPLFLATRALIRAKVTASSEASQASTGARAQLREAARTYFLAGRRYLTPATPRLIAVGGLSGSGKTTLARRLAPRIGAAPGALHLRSDAIRKQLCGTAELEPLPRAAYSEDVSTGVYAEIVARARVALAAGQAVIADAVYAAPAERSSIEELARGLKLRFDGLWLEAPPETLIARVQSRRGDASDADAAVVRRQLAFDIGGPDWLHLGADTSPEALARSAAARLQIAEA